MEQKKKEKELAKELKIENKKQEEVRKQWHIFMHSRKELEEMERREKQEKEKEKVDAVKRRLAFEEKERKECYKPWVLVLWSCDIIVIYNK